MKKPLMKLFKSFTKIFGEVNPHDVASNELREARLALLQAESGVEYSTALVDFNKKRVQRLEMYVAKLARAADANNKN